MGAALEGIRVVDLSRALGGPYCTQILGDLGADVIKVEQPGIGDETRQYMPPDWEGESCYFLSTNRNKRSITLDLKKPEGQEIVRALATRADVFVENFRTGTLEEVGLGYEDLKKINPSLIYCSVSAFGRTGPYKHKPGYDAVMQAFGGLMSVTGEPDRPPVRVGYSIVDLATGLFAAIAILAALHHRTKTGEGQMIDVSLLEAVVSLQTYLAVGYFATGKAPSRTGTAHPNAAPYEAFETRDGRHVFIACPNDRLYHKMCEVLGLEHLKSDPRFQTNPLRVRHRKELFEALNEFTRQQDTAWLLQKLEAAGIPASAINDLEGVFSDPQVQHRQMRVRAPHAKITNLELLGMPFKLSLTPGTIRMGPPLLGQHTEEILLELGYTPEKITDLKTRQVI